MDLFLVLMPLLFAVISVIAPILLFVFLFFYSIKQHKKYKNALNKPAGESLTNIAIIAMYAKCQDSDLKDFYDKTYGAAKLNHLFYEVLGEDDRRYALSLYEQIKKAFGGKLKYDCKNPPKDIAAVYKPCYSYDRLEEEDSETLEKIFFCIKRVLADNTKFDNVIVLLETDFEDFRKILSERNKYAVQLFLEAIKIDSNFYTRILTLPLGDRWVSIDKYLCFLEMVLNDYVNGGDWTDDELQALFAYTGKPI